MTAIEARWGDASISVGTADPAPAYVQGRHAFVVALTFLVRDPARPLLLDRENVHYVSRVACWWCRASTDDGTPCTGRL